MVAVGRARLPLRGLGRQPGRHRGGIGCRGDRHRVAERGQPGLMTEQVHAGRARLARRRELRPPRRHRTVQITGARRGEAQRGRRRDRLGTRKRQARRISLPSPAGSRVSLAGPKIDDHLVALVDADRRSCLLAALEMPGEDGGDAAEPLIAMALNPGLHASASRLYHYSPDFPAGSLCLCRPAGHHACAARRDHHAWRRPAGSSCVRLLVAHHAYASWWLTMPVPPGGSLCVRLLADHHGISGVDRPTGPRLARPVWNLLAKLRAPPFPAVARLCREPSALPVSGDNARWFGLSRKPVATLLPVSCSVLRRPVLCSLLASA